MFRGFIRFIKLNLSSVLDRSLIALCSEIEILLKNRKALCSLNEWLEGEKKRERERAKDRRREKEKDICIYFAPFIINIHNGITAVLCHQNIQYLIILFFFYFRKSNIC